MGNSILGAGRNKAKVMKITGEIIKLKTPIVASDVIKDYPGHVLLESEKVKRFGIRAKPLEPEEELKAKKIYFVVELPEFPNQERAPRRARSAVQMNAKDRLECLMLSRRAGSDLSSAPTRQRSSAGWPPPSSAVQQVKMRLPRAQVEKVIRESKDETELAERIVRLCAKNT